MTTSNENGSKSFNFLPLIVLVLLLAIIPLALSHIPTNANYAPTLSAGEGRATRAFERAKGLGEPELYAFLRAMPKGGDLHMHLSGAVYAETFLRDAAAQNVCVDPATLSFAKTATPGACAKGQVSAADVAKNQKLYDDLIDSFSMRSFVPHAGVSGHDQFFSTFAKFSGLKDTTGEWVNEVAVRAAAQNEQYLEIMVTPPFSNAAGAGYKLGWPTTTEGDSPAELARLRDALLAGGLRNDIALDRSQIDAAEAARNGLEHCDGQTGKPLPACSIKVTYLYQVLRGFPPQQVFAQTLLGFEVASADPRFVGINFVMPEDGFLSMSEYHRQMLMLDYLHSVYPNVHISLHAGELAQGMVAPEGLTFHIREAIDLGHAERIGHGVDILYEDNPRDLLKEMAAKNIMVEVNLTSNDGILGIKGDEHPLSAYRAAHVPFALSTDDEGVSRIDLTHEYVRGAVEQDLGYYDLKQSARDSLEHSFLPGASLWAAPLKTDRLNPVGQNFTHRQSACSGAIEAGKLPSDSCRDFLKSSERATQQYELERRFALFEAHPPALPPIPLQ